MPFGYLDEEGGNSTQFYAGWRGRVEGELK